MKVSVIIPVYKVESFIGRCARSLLKQTLADVEFIFVDDCSPDRSIQVLDKVLADYPSREENIHIIHHDKHQGLSAARNTGIGQARGEYIFHCDSDDWVEPMMLEKLYDEAVMQDADIVWCDWYLNFRKSQRYMSQPSYDTPYDALRGILSGRMKYNVWNKLIRRQLYCSNHIVFPKGHDMAEDMTIIRLFACATKVCYLPQAFYHYVRLNESAFTNTASERNILDMMFNTIETVSYLKDKFGSLFTCELEWFKLSVKFPLLVSGSRVDYDAWQFIFRNSNHFICSNRNQSLRARLLQQAAAGRQYWIVWLYYRLVQHLVYGIIYK
jgi:glycosyltransferase involved in cell wall biosynthesis